MNLEKKPPHGLIASVDTGSLAHEAGLQMGDHVTHINGLLIRDEIDFRFRTSDELIRLTAVQDGQEQLFEFEKPADEPLGIEFELDAFGGTRICNNGCFFCFLKGLPKGLRKSLYLKDDDYRLSFLHGNFVTLTNLTEDDWCRLEEQRLSPLNISVHATDLEVRRTLLGNSMAPDIRLQLRRLSEIGIEVQAQIVVCPNVNDGPVLDASIGELLTHQNVRNVGVVPVGLSLMGESRINHTGMRAHTNDEALQVIRLVHRWEKLARVKRGNAFAYVADEFYLSIDHQIPSSKRYDDFPQWENGIGMTRTLIDDWRKIRRKIRDERISLNDFRPITICCGTLIAPTLVKIAQEASKMLNVNINVIPIPNSLFGGRVNVSGLLSGDDFIRELSARPLDELGDRIVLPRSSLDYFGVRFLDDIPAERVSRIIEKPIVFAYTMTDVVELIEGKPIPLPAKPNEKSTNGRSWTTVSSV